LSFTPLNWVLKALILALKDSAAFVGSIIEEIVPLEGL
jgi:hypothetical protein